MINPSLGTDFAFLNICVVVDVLLVKVIDYLVIADFRMEVLYSREELEECQLAVFRAVVVFFKIC